MNLQEVVLTNIPSMSRHSSGGWLSFNCPCCVDQGEPRPDNRMRGGIRTDGEMISFHCFNCGYTASHRKGRIINKKFVKFMRLLGIPDSDIKRLQLDSIREKELAEGPTLFISRTQTTRVPSFPDCELPDDSKPLDEWLNQPEPLEQAILSAKYLIDRGVYDHVDAYWSPKIGYRTRVIFPFWQGDRIVGYGARDISGTSDAKYITKTPNDFLYGVDKVKGHEKFLIVVEGVIDAAVLDCVGILSNEASPIQIDYINQFKGEVIVCPDRDNAGKKLVRQAIENGWSVSFPIWEQDVKDASDAVQRYGKLYTLKTIIEQRISNSTKINVKMRLG